jgi:serine/threonine protein kinase
MVDEKSREKCLKEIRLVQSLSHPNVIQYIDAFIENNELLLVFEYAEVRTLPRHVVGCRHPPSLPPSISLETPRPPSRCLFT